MLICEDLALGGPGGGPGGSPERVIGRIPLTGHSYSNPSYDTLTAVDGETRGTPACHDPSAVAAMAYREVGGWQRAARQHWLSQSGLAWREDAAR